MPEKTFRVVYLITKKNGPMFPQRTPGRKIKYETNQIMRAKTCPGKVPRSCRNVFETYPKAESPVNI